MKELSARGQSAEPPPPFVAQDMEPSLASGFDAFKPSIAAINGYCIGIGLTVAMACDFRIAAEHAKFGYTEVKIGVPTIVGAIRTSWVTGMQTALEMLLTGDIFDIDYARQRGFVNKVVPGEQLMAEAERLAERLAVAINRAVGGLDGMSASIGFAVFPDEGATPEMLIAAADNAAMDAKRRARQAHARPQLRAA